MNKFSYLSLIAVSAAFVGCNDFDYGVTADTFKQKEYAENFEKVFGTPDPNQDWSMAMLVEANVNLPEIKGTAKMNICTGDPRNSETRLLAQVMLQDGQAHLQFDAIKGHNTVFVTVEQDGQYKVFGQYVIVDGMLNVGELALTRGGVGSIIEVPSGFSDNCPTTLNTEANGKVTVSSVSYTTDKLVGATFDNVYRTFDEWTTWVQGNVNQWGNQSPFTTESVLKWRQKFVDFSGAVLADGCTDNGDGTITTSWDTKTIEEWKETYNVNNIPSQPWTGVVVSYRDCEFGDPGAEPNGYTDPSTWVLKDNAVPTYELKQPVWQYLKNVEQAPAPAWNRGFGHTLFGPGGFFEEKEAYYGTKKRALYQDGDLVKIEEGFVIKSTGGPITLPYIFGNTAYANQFGYIYWTDDQDPLQQPHYVLMEDARPSSNVYYGTWGDTDKKVGDEALCGWDTGIDGLDAYNTAYANRESNPEMWEKVSGQQIVGTSYRVMFFNADGTGTYNFPAGYKIAFFINKMAAEGDLTGHTNHCDHNYNYSLPELNKRLYNYTDLTDPSKVTNRHYYSYTESPTYTDHHNETNGMVDGVVKAISWQQNGNYYLGFGDDSGDHDLNDIVFMVQGNFTTDNGIKLSSVKWHRNTDGSHHTNDDDIFEQSTPKIGESYTQPDSEPKLDGYTFKGWSTTPDDSSNDCSKTISGTATAAGICYYAIWEPAGDAVKINWHFNYGGEHIEKHNGETGNDVYATNTVAKSTGKYSKPSTNPSYIDATKVFKGWALDPDATDVIDPATLINVTAGDADVCYYAIWMDAPTPGGDPEPMTWIFACEDLGGTFDYDFNDVVWSVSHVAGQTTATVELLAAGGTLPFTLNYNGTKITTKLEALGQTDTPVIERITNKSYSLTVDSEWTLEANKDKFTVVVDASGTSTVISTYKRGEAQGKTPQVLLLPGSWTWPGEGVSIESKYPGFKTWTGNATNYFWADQQ